MKTFEVQFEFGEEVLVDGHPAGGISAVIAGESKEAWVESWRVTEAPK